MVASQNPIVLSSAIHSSVFCVLVLFVFSIQFLNIRNEMSGKEYAIHEITLDKMTDI